MIAKFCSCKINDFSSIMPKVINGSFVLITHFYFPSSGAFWHYRNNLRFFLFNDAWTFLWGVGEVYFYIGDWECWDIFDFYLFLGDFLNFFNWVGYWSQEVVVDGRFYWEIYQSVDVLRTGIRDRELIRATLSWFFLNFFISSITLYHTVVLQILFHLTVKSENISIHFLF